MLYPLGKQSLFSLSKSQFLPGYGNWNLPSCLCPSSVPCPPEDSMWDAATASVPSSFLGNASLPIPGLAQLHLGPYPVLPRSLLPRNLCWISLTPLGMFHPCLLTGLFSSHQNEQSRMGLEFEVEMKQDSNKWGLPLRGPGTPELSMLLATHPVWVPEGQEQRKVSHADRDSLGLVQPGFMFSLETSCMTGSRQG